MSETPSQNLHAAAEGSFEIMCCDGYLEVKSIEQQGKSVRHAYSFPTREKHIDVCQEGISADDEVEQCQSRGEQNDLHILQSGSLQHQTGCQSYGIANSIAHDKPTKQKLSFRTIFSTSACYEQETSPEPLPELISQHPWLPCPMSAGSRGHPEFCRRPCNFLLRQGYCRMGLDCTFCHLEHWSRSAHHISKVHREMMRNLPCSVILATTIPVVHERMERIIAKAKKVPTACQSLSVLQQELCDILKASLAKVTRTNISVVTNTDLRKLAQELSRVNLSFLISLIVRSLRAEDEDAAEALQVYEHRIRSAVEQYML
eukprot:TRINITY_DN6720_c0_g1_i3.p1 TRINITY_DN6720_c0_g1~~TRINITY_DN6720_c0_g1_i3.p1  ORF type:complete len:336 (+),score=26.30 TRINITY_DN6720_c0_g1_i3:62-1009(+)